MGFILQPFRRSRVGLRVLKLGYEAKHHSRGYEIGYQFRRCLVCFSVNLTKLSRCVYAFALFTRLLKFVGLLILVQFNPTFIPARLEIHMNKKYKLVVYV